MGSGSRGRRTGNESARWNAAGGVTRWGGTDTGFSGDQQVGVGGGQTENHHADEMLVKGKFSVEVSRGR